MILSRKRLYKIKKTREQSRRRRKHRNKKKYKRRQKGKSRRRKRALNLRKRTMKVYRGGVNKDVLSFVFPDEFGNLLLVSFDPRRAGAGNASKKKALAKDFINAACRIPGLVHLEGGETDTSWESNGNMRDMVLAISAHVMGADVNIYQDSIDNKAFLHYSSLDDITIKHLGENIKYDTIGAKNLRDLNRSLLQKQLQGNGFLKEGSQDISAAYKQAAKSLAKQISASLFSGISLAEQASIIAEKTTDDVPVTPPAVGDDQHKSTSTDLVIPSSFGPDSSTASIVAALKQLGEACNPGAGENCAAGLKCGNLDDEGKGICISEQPPPSTPLGEGKSDVKIGFIDILSKKLDKFIGSSRVEGDSRDIFFGCINQILLPVAHQFDMTGPWFLQEGTSITDIDSLVLSIRITNLKEINNENIDLLNKLLRLFVLTNNLEQFNELMDGLDLKKFIIDLAKLYRNPEERITTPLINIGRSKNQFH